jgi:hypothetical protein
MSLEMGVFGESLDGTERNEWRNRQTESYYLSCVNMCARVNTINSKVCVKNLISLSINKIG